MDILITFAIIALIVLLCAGMIRLWILAEDALGPWSCNCSQCQLIQDLVKDDET